MTLINQKSQTGLYVGDKIQIDGIWGAVFVCEIELFRDCLGFFISPDHRKAGEFKPLCDMYGVGSGSQQKYIPNYGTYIEDPVALWSQVPSDTPIGGW